MSCFPIFIDMQGKKVFVAGGGPVAYRKSRTLLAFGCEITVFAKEVLPLFHEEGRFRVLEGTLKETELEGLLLDFDMVIAATSIRELNHKIAKICGRKRIPVNVADCGREGNFLFPAVVARKNVTIGISTGGTSPTLAGWLRKRLDDIVPDNIDRTAELLEEFEKQLKQAGLRHEERGNIIRDILHKSADENGFPDYEKAAQETAVFLKRGSY